MKRVIVSVVMLLCGVFIGLSSVQAQQAQGGATMLKPPPFKMDLGATFGPEVGWSFGQDGQQGLLVGGELVVAIVSIADLFPLWTTLGYRGVAGAEDGWISRPYAELGVWALVNFGVGYGPEFIPRKDVSHKAHVFAGVPVYGFSAFRDGTKDPGRIFYLEPYYRYVMPLQDKPGLASHHEAGVMFKVVLWGVKARE